jgi:hydroxymethylglutaryl-CoA reductase
MATSSRLKLRDVDIAARHDLLTEESGLDRAVLDAFRPEGSARELAEVIVAVGLAQNVAAFRALATEGIQRGHMSLHARNVAVAAGATSEELPFVVERLIRDRAVRTDQARRILAQLRSPESEGAG